MVWSEWRLICAKLVDQGRRTLGSLAVSRRAFLADRQAEAAVDPDGIAGLFGQFPVGTLGGFRRRA
ncbi:hypothetical protein ACM43_35075 [Bradyrhizobium sp. CCBAU 45321]|nr:hypothetical protein [Bradyrhizobium sp. CCBAU 45321]